MSSEKLMIIDGNSIMNRAFYAMQGERMLSASDGLHTNAVFGFLNILNKFVEDEKPQYLCVAFDLKAPTFRHIEFEGYKAKRKGMPQELAEQMPVIKEVLDAMNIKCLEMEGFEADDIIGSVSLCAERLGISTVIVTGDRDSLQLASENTKILIPVTRGGKTATESYDVQGVVARYGVLPAQFIDVKGLMGDPSDNIPGVPGIGEKTAVELIKEFGSIDGIYKNIDRVEKKSIREKLEAYREQAYMSKKIATIDRNMPQLCAFSELKRNDYDRSRLYSLFKRLEFKSLIAKYGLSDPAGGKAGIAADGSRTAAEDSILTSGSNGAVDESILTQDVKFILVNDPISLAQVAASVSSRQEAAVYHILERPDAFSSSLAGLAVSWGDENAYINIKDDIGEDQFLQQFTAIFESSRIKLYGHDLKSLIVYLKWRGIRFSASVFDTMIGAYILDASRNTYTVPELAREYLGYSIEDIGGAAGKGKSSAVSGAMPAEALSKAAAGYSRAIYELKSRIDSEICRNGQERLLYEIELPLVEVLADMEFRGFKVDTEGLRQFSARLDEKINRVADEIYSFAEETFNINSTKQLGAILFEKLGLPVIKKTKTGYSTDAEVLEQLADKHEIVTRILEYRQLVKLKTTYAEGLLNMVNPRTGRIHSSFNQTVTATGRISSTEPNLQNIPVRLEMGREIRKVFIPENSDYLLSDADYSQIELRVLAHITGDANLIEAFRNNEDIHAATASGVFKVPADQVTPLLRSRAKAVNFGIVYGIGDFSLAKDLGITRKEARQYIDEYLERYPEVKKYMHNTVENGKKNGFVETIFNRRRYLPELKSANHSVRSFGERVAMNTPIQGSAADIIKIAMVKVYKELNSHNMKSRLILQVHDELIIETHVSEREQVEKILRDCMQDAVRLDVPLVVEVKTGGNWYETK